MKKIILLGSGGQAKSCIEVINSKKLFKVSGLITNSKEKNFQNIKILGDNNYLENLKNKRKINLHIAIGFISSPKLRIKLFFNFKKMNFKFPVIIAKSAIVSKNSNILDGTIVHHGAFINNGARIGFNTIINSLDFLINSNNLDLMYENNLVVLYNIKNALYGKSTLEADKITLDILTRDVSINMYKNEDKIKIIYK